MFKFMSGIDGLIEEFKVPLGAKMMIGSVRYVGIDERESVVRTCALGVSCIW